MLGEIREKQTSDIDLITKVEQLLKDSDLKMDRETKLAKLRGAYLICRSLLNDSQMLVKATIILTEFAILHFGQEVPGVADLYSYPQKLLLAALHGFLTSIRANSLIIKLPEDLSRSPGAFVCDSTFDYVVQEFQSTDPKNLIILAHHSQFAMEQKAQFSRILHYLISCNQHLKNLEPKFVTNAQHLAESLVQFNMEEFWERQYIDWRELLKSKGRYSDIKLLQLFHWLLENAVEEGQRARVYREFFVDETEVRNFLQNCLGLIKKKIKPEQFVALNKILNGSELSLQHINNMAILLNNLHFEEEERLTMSWFSMTPMSLAYFLLIRFAPENHDEIEGLLKLSRALVAVLKKNNFTCLESLWKKYRDRSYEYAAFQATLAVGRATEHLQKDDQNIEVEKNRELITKDCLEISRVKIIINKRIGLFKNFRKNLLKQRLMDLDITKKLLMTRIFSTETKG